MPNLLPVLRGRRSWFEGTIWCVSVLRAIKRKVSPRFTLLSARKAINLKWFHMCALWKDPCVNLLGPVLRTKTAELQESGWGMTSDPEGGGGGDEKTFFSVTFYNFQKLGGGGVGGWRLSQPLPLRGAWRRLQNSPLLRQKSENRGFWASFDARSWNGRTRRAMGREARGKRKWGDIRLSLHFLFPLAARLLPRPVLPFNDRASKLAQKPRF